jgi:hypothetical protein
VRDKFVKMGVLLSRLWKEHSIKIISVCIICLATVDPRKIIYSLVYSPRMVILSGVSILALIAAILTVREAYVVLKENKRQEELLLKKKTEDRKNGSIFKNAREKLERMARRGGKKRLLSCSIFLKDVCHMPASLSVQLGDLIELFVRDFICNWWSNIGTDHTFVDDVRVTALGAVVEISRRASTVNVPVFLATDALEALRHHIIWFKELSRRVASKHSTRMVKGSVNTTFFEDRNRLIEVALRNEGRMHVACESEEAELEYLRHITNEILARILTNKDYECPMVRHLFREALAQTVFSPIFTSISEPNFMNWIIEKIFDDTKDANTMDEKEQVGKSDIIDDKSSSNFDDNRYGENDDNVKNDEKISLRYYAGVMSNKLAEKYLSDMPACTFLIRRDEINLNTYIISSVGYVNSKMRKARLQNQARVGEFGRARTVSAPEVVSNLTAKLSFSHWYVRLHNNTFFLIAEGDDMKNTNRNKKVSPNRNNNEHSINNNQFSENVLYAGQTMTSVLYYMRSYFVGGLHFVDGKEPLYEILPWCISHHVDSNALPKCKLIFKKNKDSVVVDGDGGNVYVEIMSRAGIVRRKSLKSVVNNDMIPESDLKISNEDKAIVDGKSTSSSDVERLRRQTMQDFSFLGFGGDNDEVDLLFKSTSRSTTASSSTSSTPTNSPKRQIDKKIVPSGKEREHSHNAAAAGGVSNGHNNYYNNNNTKNIVDHTFDESYLDRRASYLGDVDEVLNDESTYNLHNADNDFKAHRKARQNLLNNLEVALSKAQNDYCSGDLKNDMLEKHHNSVRNLMYALESILMYGLKQTSKNDKASCWKYLSSISKISSDADLVIEMIDQMSNIEILAKKTFWDQKQAVSTIEQFPDTSTEGKAVEKEYIQNLGKSRAFLIIGLNKSLLAKYLNLLMEDKDATTLFYEPYSIIASAKDKKYFRAQLDILLTMEFNINMNDVWDSNSDDLINQEKAKVLAKTKRNSQEHLKKIKEKNEKNTTRSVLRKLSTGSSSKVKDIGHKLMKLNLFGNKPIPKKRNSSTNAGIDEKNNSAIVGNTSKNCNEQSDDEEEDDQASELNDKIMQKLKGKGSSKLHNLGSNKRRKKTKTLNRASLWVGPDNQVVGGNNLPIESPKNGDSKRYNRTSILTSTGRENIDNLSKVKLEELRGPFSIVLRAEVTHASLVDSEKKASFFQNNQPHVEYHIRIQSIVTIGDYESIDTWEITQRYRIFFQLHRTLKSTYKLRISLPPKQIALFSAEKFDRRFLETRRVALNTYLNEVLAHPVASRSKYLLAFLDVPNNVFEWKSVWKRMKERDTESLIFHSSPRKKRPVRSSDNSSNMHRNSFVVGNNDGSNRSKSHHAQSSKLNKTNDGSVSERAISLGTKTKEDKSHGPDGKLLPRSNGFNIKKKNENGKITINSDTSNSILQNGLKKKTIQKNPIRLTTTIEMASVEHHIFNLAREIFEIDDLSLMRRKFVNMMHGFMNITSKGSAYNYLNNVLGHMVETEKIADTAKFLKDYLWPDGKWDDEPVPDDTTQVMISRREKSLELLRNNIPESLENLFTKAKCQNGIDTLHDFLQCKILVKNFVYTFIDLMLLQLFDDISVIGLHQVRK